MRDLQNSDAQLKINHLHGLFTPKLLFCPLCSRVLQEALINNHSAFVFNHHQKIVLIN
jgi:hypothetical protein